MPAPVITLTLNPAIDVSGEVERLVPGHKLRCHQVRRDPGGGGINVARVLSRLGADVLAVFPSAGSSGKSLERYVAAEKVPYLAIPVRGETRENLTVSDKAAGLQYRFVFPGEESGQEDIVKCCDQALGKLSAGGFLVASGSLPPGASPETYVELARRVALAGGNFVLDTSGEPLAHALKVPIAVLKVSERELIEAMGIGSRSQIHAAARQLVKRGLGLVVVTSGEKGALLAGPDFVYSAEMPPIAAATSIGAGDSFLAGLIFELARGKSPATALRTAAAAGAAALLSPGTMLCKPEMVEILKEQVQVNALAAV